MDRLRTIATFPNITDAYLFKGRLEEEGIEVFVTDATVSFTPVIARNDAGGVRLSVKDADKEKAAELISHIRADSNS